MTTTPPTPARRRDTTAIRLALGAVGAVHALPVAGALSRAHLERGYGLTVTDHPTELLLRHRAVLLGVVGAGIVAGATRPGTGSPRAAAVVAAVSAGSFAVLAARTPTTTRQLARVARVDVVLTGVSALAVGLLARRAGSERRAR